MSTTSQDSAKPHRKLGNNAFFFIILTVFIDMLAFAVIAPVVPRLIAELLHGSAVGTASPEAYRSMISEAAPWGGAMSMIYAVLNFVTQPVLGNLSDRFGRRPVLLVSMATLALDFVIMGFAHSLWLLFVGRILTGISGATHSTASAYIADVTEPEQRGKAFGMLGLAFGLGFVLGPVLGGVLGEINPRAPFFASAALAGINVLYGLFVLPESLDHEHRRAFDWKRANPIGAFQRFKSLPHMRSFFLAYGLYMFGHWVYPATFSYYGQIRYGWGEAMTGWALGAVGISSAIVQGLLLGRFMRAWGATKSAIVGLSVSAGATLAYAFAYDAWMLFAIIPIGALAGIWGPSLQQIMSARVEKNAQGELSGALASVSAFGSIFAPVVMTQTLHFFTRDNTPFYFPGASFLLAGLVTVLAIFPLLSGLRATNRIADAASVPTSIG